MRKRKQRSQKTVKAKRARREQEKVQRKKARCWEFSVAVIKSKLGSVKNLLSKHIHPTSHYPPHERIKTFRLKRILRWQSLKSNRGQCWVQYRKMKVHIPGACINSTTSLSCRGLPSLLIVQYFSTDLTSNLKPLKYRLHAIVKVQKFSMFPMGILGRAASLPVSLFGSVKKKRYFRPCRFNHSRSWALTSAPHGLPACAMRIYALALRGARHHAHA